MRYLLNIDLTMRDKRETRCDILSKMFVKKLRYGDVFLILRIAYQDSKGRGKKEGEEEGGLVCAVHQVKRFSCKGSIVFVGGVNFCGEWSTSASSASTGRRISKLCNREPAAAIIYTSSHFGSKKWQQAPRREPLWPTTADGAVETSSIQQPGGFSFSIRLVLVFFYEVRISRAPQAPAASHSRRAEQRKTKINH